MELFRKSIFFFLSVGFVCICFGADLLSLKIKALQEELRLDHVSVTSMGGGDDVILEGQVPSAEISAFAQTVSQQYFSNVFNVLTVEKPSFSHQFHAILFKKATEGLQGSHYLETLKEGASNNQPWYFLLSDNKEADTFKAELSLLAGQILESSGTRHEDDFKFKLNSKEIPWEIHMKTISMGNGCLKTSVKVFSTVNPQTAQLLLENTLISKQGEWLALTEFTQYLTPIATSTDSDLIFLFQPILSVSALTGKFDPAEQTSFTGRFDSTEQTSFTGRFDSTEQTSLLMEK
jgi:hypothetical protein